MLVTVLMSTYNGEKYLREQLDSIIKQENVDLRIVVRDDGSSDGTVSILDEYSKKYKFISYYKGSQNLKPCKSFLELIRSNTDSDYFALSDQDDIWDRDKLITAIRFLQAQDQTMPALYFSNLRIVDENNKYYRNSHDVPRNLNNKYNALIATAATGCTIVYNKKLAEIANRVKPRTFSMHDTWLYLTCAFFGNVIYDFEPHINYRQHHDNVIGAQLSNRKLPHLTKEIKRLCDRNLQPRYDNAVEFLREFGTELSENDLKKVLEVVNYKRTRKTRKLLMNDQDIIPRDGFNRFRIRMLIRLGIV